MHVILLNMIKGNLFLYVHRFDKLLYLGVSEDNESQMRILAALTRKYVRILISSIHCSYDYCEKDTH